VCVYVASSIIVLSQMVTESELLDDREYQEILEDVQEECKKYGAVLKVIIPRPGRDPRGVGKVWVWDTSHVCPVQLLLRCVDLHW